MQGYIEIDKIPSNCYSCNFCQSMNGGFDTVCIADQSLRRVNYNEKPLFCPIKTKDE